MAKFFIDRPIFAWVIALFILVAGAVSITKLPISQYPTIAPPSIVVSVAYPGASAKTLEDSVLSVIEQEMNGSPGLIYMESVSQANGTGTLTLTFETGTNSDLAQVDVQNRLSRATPRLPAAVTQQGVRVEKSRSNFLMVVMLVSDDPRYDPIALGDYASRNVVPEIQRTPGVGQAQLFGSERAMRIWIDPAKLVGYKLSVADVNAAIRSQNAQVSAGSIGDLPNTPDQRISATVVVDGQLQSVEEFGNIVLRANTDGSTVRLKDVARIELGGQSYATRARLNGKDVAGIGVQLSPTGNALATATAIRERMAELEKYFPHGVKYDVPYDSSRFVQISISQVVETLLEAVVLVFLVMLLFLQNLRYTLIPTIVVPVALMGAFTVMSAAGFSINVLTMFGLAAGVRATLGHVSVRVPGRPDLFVVKGRGYRADALPAMRPEDMVVVDMDGVWVDGPKNVVPCFEVKIHSCILRDRPDVNSVVHVHPKYSVLLSVLKRNILPMCQEGAKLVLDPIPVYPRQKIVTSDEEGTAVAKTLGDGSAALLFGHGAVTAGASMEESIMSTPLSQRGSLCFSHVGIYVRDVQRMARFYQEVLAFHITDRGLLGQTQLVFLSREPTEHHQIVLASGRPEELAFNLINQISLRVPDLSVLREVHRRAAHDPDVSELVSVTHGNAISIYFRDPEGNRHEVFMDTPWYCEQPLRELIDLTQSDDAIMDHAHRIAKSRPKYQPRAQWQAEMAKRMGYVTQ